VTLDLDVIVGCDPALLPLGILVLASPVVV
jgi:hypothetical protein